MLKSVFRDFWKTDLSLKSLRDRAFGEWFTSIADEFFAVEQDNSPVPGLVGSAYGTVLELGPATGNQISRFDKTKVDYIYGVEPCQTMHGELRKNVEAAGWDKNYLQLVSAVEDERSLAAESFDCVVSIQVLCSVQNPELVVKRVYDLLKPGGALIFWEHHESDDWLTRRVQGLYPTRSKIPPRRSAYMKLGFWNLSWPWVVGGCRLDRHTKRLLLDAGDWEKVDVSGDQEPFALFPRTWGTLIKASNGKAGPRMPT